MRRVVEGGAQPRGQRRHLARHLVHAAVHQPDAAGFKMRDQHQRGGGLEGIGPRVGGITAIELAQALRRTPAPMVYIGNLGRELSPAAASLSLADKLDLMEQYVGKKIIDGVVVGPKVDVSGIGDRVVVQEPLEASDIKYRHDRHLLREALEKAIQALG